MADSLSEMSGGFNNPLNNDEIKNAKDKKELRPKFDTSTGKSLFDRNAVIDYGRFISSKSWEDYKKDSNNNFILNSHINGHNSVVSDDDINEITIPNLIQWSEKYPALQLKFQDFVYCKKMGYYPNNRLVVLRRFTDGVPDNLFDYYHRTEPERTQPISTMITWLSHEENFTDSFSFGEGWEETPNGGVVQLLKDMWKETTTFNADNAFTKLLETTVLPLYLDTSDDSELKRKDGLKFSDNEPAGDPNFINKSMKRSGDAKGINSSIKFKLKFEYELRYINGVDPSIAMIDLLANSFRMGSSTSRFRYPIDGLTQSDYLSRIQSAAMTIETDSFLDGMAKYTEKTYDQFVEIVSKTWSWLTADQKEQKASELQREQQREGVDVFSSFLTQYTSRYRERLRAAIAADTGLPSGTWHVTIGNPKKPIISCGDLYIESGSLELGKELGYNDFPNSFSCTFNMNTSRQRGRDELERIFNAGRGRVYVYQKTYENPDNFIPKPTKK